MRLRIGTCSPRSVLRKASGSGPGGRGSATASRIRKSSGVSGSGTGGGSSSSNSSGSRKRASSACSSGRDRAHPLAERQGDLGRVPVAAAREAEDPRRQRRRQRRVLPQRGARALGPVEQQPDVEPAAEEVGGVGTREVDQRAGLLQRAHRQQLVDAGDEQRVAGALGVRPAGRPRRGAGGGRARGPPARPSSGCCSISARTSARAVRAPERAGEAGGLRRQQADRVAADLGERRHGDLAGRRGGRSAAAGRLGRRRGVAELDALGQPRDRAARAFGPGRQRGGQGGRGEARPRDHFASTGSSTWCCGAGGRRRPRSRRGPPPRPARDRELS